MSLQASKGSVARDLLKALALGVFVATPLSALAGGLTLSPISMRVDAPAQTTTLTIKSNERKPVHIQIRVVRWVKQNGVDQYSPTTDVVASPPAATLSNGQELTVRIVRNNKVQTTERECYRVVIDKLPSLGGVAGTVQLAIRHSLPLCFFLGS